MIGLLFVAISLSFGRGALCQDEKSAPTMYVFWDDLVTLDCPYLDRRTTTLTWKFQSSFTEKVKVAARLTVEPSRRLTVISHPFSVPRGRSVMKGGNFTIKKIWPIEDGEYWCEVIREYSSILKGPKHPIRVYVIPQDRVFASENRTLTEFEPSKAATCRSSDGKPAAKITWFNGTEEMTSSRTIVTPTPLQGYLSDSYRDLMMTSPSRYDHNRTFSCVIEHPTYNEPKILNYTVLVNHPPSNITMWANVTLKLAYCQADGGFPEPTYSWTGPRDSIDHVTDSTIAIPNLLNLTGDEVFECTASNGFLPSVTARAVADELRYPFQTSSVRCQHSLHPLVRIGLVLTFVVIAT